MPDTFTVTRDRFELWRVTFDNPPTNVIDPEMINELDELVGQLEADTAVTVVVFDSANSDHFLGPYDLSRAEETPNRPGPTGMPNWLDLTSRLSRAPVVSIAVIHGTCRGLGNEFALACDLRFASLERARFDQPEVSRGLVPGGGSVARLPGLVGRARTLEIVLGSVVLDAATAERYGMINRAVPDADLDQFVADLANPIADHDRESLTVAKSLINLSTLPADGDLISGYQAFFDSMARRAR